MDFIRKIVLSISSIQIRSFASRWPIWPKLGKGPEIKNFLKHEFGRAAKPDVITISRPVTENSDDFTADLNWISCAYCSDRCFSVHIQQKTSAGIINMIKAVVLGAAGAMAAVAIKDLLELGGDVSITAADFRMPSFNDKRIRSVTVDVNDIENTAKILEGHDVVLNCVNYYFNVPVMKAALMARVPYIDLGGLYHGTLKQYELNNDFKNAGIPALLGMGSTPGITNVMAGELAEKLDAVEELHVRVACYDETASGPLPVPYALDTVLDEFAMEPMVFRNGKPKQFVR